jgi:hypothetical protein
LLRAQTHKNGLRYAAIGSPVMQRSSTAHALRLQFCCSIAARPSQVRLLWWLYHKSHSPLLRLVLCVRARSCSRATGACQPGGSSVDHAWPHSAPVRARSHAAAPRCGARGGGCGFPKSWSAADARRSRARLLLAPLSAKNRGGRACAGSTVVVVVVVCATKTVSRRAARRSARLM